MAPSAKLDLEPRQAARLPGQWQPPLLGLAWVLFNAAFIWFALVTGYFSVCSLAGAVDGAVISIVVVKKFSERFQATATGLLGGLGIDSAAADPNQSIASKLAHTIHMTVDGIFDSAGPAIDEKIHKAFEAAVIQAIWVAVIVILAALIARWAQSVNDSASAKNA